MLLLHLRYAAASSTRAFQAGSLSPAADPLSAESEACAESGVNARAMAWLSAIMWVD